MANGEVSNTSRRQELYTQTSGKNHFTWFRTKIYMMAVCKVSLFSLHSGQNKIFFV